MFIFAQETPYSFETVGDFNCEPNRGQPDNPMLMLHHWVTPPLARTGGRANSAEVLLERLEVCQDIRGLLPSILAVDFYARGDALDLPSARRRGHE